jgi:hypothetical protein
LAGGALSGSSERHPIASSAPEPIGSAMTYDADLDRSRRLMPLVTEGFASSLTEAATRFALSHPAMGTILVGMATPQQFEDALAAVQKGPLPRTARDRLSALRQGFSGEPRWWAARYRMDLHHSWQRKRRRQFLSSPGRGLTGKTVAGRNRALGTSPGHLWHIGHVETNPVSYAALGLVGPLCTFIDSSQVREKMFNPFFTTKPTGEGTGLGLSMTHDIIVKQHGGRIDVETEPGVFTEFIITLPRNNGAAPG